MRASRAASDLGFVFRALQATGSMMTILALCAILFATIATISAAQAQTAPGKPRITRVIEADFAKEEFTIRYRPPASDGGSPIIGYYIYRSQNRFLSEAEVKLEPPNAYPTRCDELTPGQWRITSGSGRLITDPEEFYTEVRTLSTSGQSWGNCYRWHLIAVNSVNRHPTDDSIIPPGSNEAVTDPIYSRGYDHNGVRYSYDRTHNNSGAACPAGRARGYSYRSRQTGMWTGSHSPTGIICAIPDHLYAYDTCVGLNAALLISTGDGTLFFCGIRSSDTGICARYGFSRNEGQGDGYQRCDGRRCGDENSLAQYNSDHRECQCLGWAEPTTAGQNAPTDCECSVIGANPSDCECPAGATYDPETHTCECSITGANSSCQCPAGTTYDSETNSCECPSGQTFVTTDDSSMCLSPIPAPTIARVIEADFASETFTLQWRAPATDTQDIIGYHIRRQQNIRTISGLDANSHPTQCDQLTDAQWRWSDSGARTDYTFLTGGIVVDADVFSYSEQVSTTGASHGSCYRWRITAFTESAVGTTVVTNPILARSTAGRQGCDAGQAKPWTGGSNPYSAACTSQERVEGGEWCHSNGGSIVTSTEGNTYQCHNVNAACADAGYDPLLGLGSGTFCSLSSGGQCAVGEQFNLDHRECLCQGWATPKSSGSGCECTVDKASTLCECPLNSAYSP